MKIKVLFLLVITILKATGATIDTAQIDQLTGLKGRLNEKEGTYKISFTREDITVFVDGWKIPAFMGLSTWAAFTKATHSEAMVMGDTVLSRMKLIWRCSWPRKRPERYRFAQPFL